MPNAQLTYQPTRNEFYKRLREHIIGQPTRTSSVRGVSWPADVKCDPHDPTGPRCLYHNVLVQPYSGNEYTKVWGRRAIPRIYVNCFDAGTPNQAEVQRWTGSRRLSAAKRSTVQLELTVALDELVDFAAWVVAWAAAHDASDPTRLPESPHPLQGACDPFGSYLWTVAAHNESEAPRWKKAS